MKDCMNMWQMLPDVQRDLSIVLVQAPPFPSVVVCWWGLFQFKMTSWSRRWGGDEGKKEKNLSVKMLHGIPLFRVCITAPPDKYSAHLSPFPSPNAWFGVWRSPWRHFCPCRDPDVFVCVCV